MSKKQYFDSKFWSDVWIVDELEPIERYIFMYLMLNEKKSLAGVYELSVRTMSHETAVDKKELENILKKLEPKVFYENGWVVLKNGMRYQNYRNSKIAEGMRRELCKVPSDLLDLIEVPDDFPIDLTCDINESSMSHGETLHLIKRKEKKIKENKRSSAAAPASPSRGFKKPSKSQYARAVEADKALAEKERSARTRQKAPVTTQSLAEIFPGGAR